MLFSEAQAQSGLTLGGVVRSAADGQTEITPLRVGQKVPDEFWTKVHLFYVNRDTVRQTFKEYRGKPIILDFWAQWCSPCIASLKKVNTFLHQLSENGIFMPVTSDRFTSAQPVWEKQGFTFPSIIEDNVLEKLFPRATIPHVVWIDAGGTVAHISNQEPLYAESMQRFFLGQMVDITQKTDIDKRKPLLLDNKADIENVQQYQLVLKGRQDYLPMLKFTRNTIEGVYSKTFINTPLLIIYKAIANDIFHERGETLFKQNFQIDLKDSIAINEPYTLDVISASENKIGFNNHLIELLNGSSDFVAEMKLENIQCLVLKKLDDSQKIGTSGGTRIREVDWSAKINLQNAPLAFFQNLLMDEKLTGKYIVNETGYKGNIDVQLTVANDLTELNGQLAKMGLRLEEAHREVAIFTIKKSKFPKHE